MKFHGLNSLRLRLRGAVSEDGGMVAFGGEDGVACVWDTNTGLLCVFMSYYSNKPYNHPPQPFQANKKIFRKNCLLQPLQHHLNNSLIKPIHPTTVLQPPSNHTTPLQTTSFYTTPFLSTPTHPHL